MLSLPKQILTIDGIIGYVLRGPWFQDVRHQVGIFCHGESLSVLQYVFFFLFVLENPEELFGSK